MSDKPEVKAADLKADGLKKTTTHVAGNELDPKAVEGLAAQWEKDFDTTKAKAAFSGMAFKEKWVTDLKSKSASEQAKFFAEGILSGLALQD